MANQATATYLFHSGFLVSVEDTLLVFDYWQGEEGMFPERPASPRRTSSLTSGSSSSSPTAIRTITTR